MTLLDETDSVMRGDLLARIVAAGKPNAICGNDGKLASQGTMNCRDRRGFRIVVGDHVRVFSIRHSEPTFIFGIKDGMLFSNQKISSAVLASEQSSFIRYVRNEQM
ncbi:hypothetical protein G6L37_01290 [Agrobacterium rubi]|nr:hypothetical protein [Agrobacterium rubi]NTF24026.1 hypothetical protein [Agrobacterium rubi]